MDKVPKTSTQPGEMSPHNLGSQSLLVQDINFQFSPSRTPGKHAILLMEQKTQGLYLWPL